MKKKIDERNLVQKIWHIFMYLTTVVPCKPKNHILNMFRKKKKKDRATSKLDSIRIGLR